MKYLSMEFPDQIEIVLQCRAADPEFGSICADFEEIATHLETLISRGIIPIPSSLSDLTHTLQQLRAEIVAYLEHNASTIETSQYRNT